MRAIRLLVSLVLGYVLVLMVLVLSVGMWLFSTIWPSSIPDYTILHVLGGAIVWVAMALNISTPGLLISLAIGAVVGIMVYKVWNRLIGQK